MSMHENKIKISLNIWDETEMKSFENYITVEIEVVRDKCSRT